MSETRTPYEADEPEPARGLMTRTTRLISQLDAAVAHGGVAYVHIRDLGARQAESIVDHGDGLLRAVAPANQGEGAIWFFEDDLVAVETTGFQEPA